MNYYQARIKYLEKKRRNPLPPLKKNERIYLQVTYYDKYYAQYCHCGFDAEIKLWFTGCLNSNLCSLVKLYGVHSATSKKAMKLLRERCEVIE